MAFKRQSVYRGFELTSLIDIVFLLLIFFLVSFAFSLAGDVSESSTYSELELPKTNTALPVISQDLLENLMIQIMPDTTRQLISKVAYVLWPSFDDTTKISRGEALRKAMKDSTFAGYPNNFLGLSDQEFQELPVNRLISESIARFVKLKRFYYGDSRPIIEVRAKQNTEFRILSFIMDECSSPQDAIPQIIVRTAL